jgi:excisionase family DNA binding protein
MAKVDIKKTGYVTTTQYAKYTGMSPSTVLRAVISKQIKAVRTPGGHFRIPAGVLIDKASNPWWNYQPSKKEIQVGRKQIMEAFERGLKWRKKS